MDAMETVLSSLRGANFVYKLNSRIKEKNCQNSLLHMKTLPNLCFSKVNYPYFCVQILLRHLLVLMPSRSVASYY